MATYILIATIAVGTIAVFAAFLRTVMRSGASLPHDRTWLDEFSIDKYRPMLRLLSERDFEYLAMQSGFTPELARRLRVERRKIFRAYLRNLIRDFNRLHGAARELVAQAPQDRSELAAALARQQFAFYAGIAGVYFRLGLYTIGVGSVDIRGLLQQLESFRVVVAANSTVADFA